MPDSTTRVLNFFGGPGAGKSTIKAGTFFALKCRHLRTAQIEEYATECVFEEDWETIRNQPKLLAEQEKRQARLVGKVDWIVTDSPLVLSSIYVSAAFDTQDFHDEVWRRYDAYENVNILVRRVQPYQTYGRHHSEREALEVDDRIEKMMAGSIDFEVDGDVEAPRRVYEYLSNRYLRV